MKIGIVTFWQTRDNYGQILQCFALQEALRKNGHEPELIRTNFSVELSFKVRMKNFLKKIVRFFSKKIYYGVVFEFWSKHVKYTKKIFLEKKDFSKEDLNYDAFICGSDVVWSENVGMGSFGEMCFLGFVSKPRKKISYAASFGSNELSDTFSFFVKEKIKDYHRVSVREESGVGICANLGRCDAASVCDPTFLLERVDYMKLFSYKRERKFVLEYFIGWSTKVPEQEIEKFVLDNDMTVKRIFSQRKKRKIFNRMTVSKWLQKYSSANAVFTNSYHGTIFALIFNKPFIYFPLGGSAQKLNDRVINLLCKMDLVSRIWNPDKSIEEQVYEKIEWTRVNSKIIKWREFSINWLKNALES